MTRIFQNDLLGGSFCLAVKMQRIGRVSFGVIPLAPVENQIGGEKNERNFRRQFREQFCGFNIHPARKSGIFLRPGDGADGGAVNDQLRLVLLELPADGGEIEQVKIRSRSARASASGANSARSGRDNFRSARPRR